MPREISKIYQANQVEDSIYKQWEESGYFNPDKLPDFHGRARKKPFSVALPPPNATGVLHCGHAVMLVIQDLTIRYQRMSGKKTLWVPGTDHAAIATQTVVEKLLAREGKNKYDLGREKFLERVNDYVARSQNTIHQQMRKMGASCDWSRERYTLDQGLSAAVSLAFARMYQGGLIYRGYRIVNWCPRCESTLADDEVEYKTQNAQLYYIKYGPFVIATTRPETKLGDTAVAVHPDDARYQDFISREYDVKLGLVQIHIKVIADRAIDPGFGTGALGVTPAHSLIDYEMAQKNNLKVIPVIGPDGRMTAQAGPYAGLMVASAREKFVADLKAAGQLEKIQEIENNLSVCYRCDAPIEPMPSKQWFVDVNKKFKVKGKKLKYPKAQASLKELAIHVVKSGQIKIIPAHFHKLYFHWLENLRDWCISRQIWFGHRIPVWYRKQKISNSQFSISNEGVASRQNKIWDLKIYGPEVFGSLQDNTKTLETRAGRKPGTGKDWSEFKPGDIINFSLADEATDAIVSGLKPVKKIVAAVRHFGSIEELVSAYQIKRDYHGRSLDQIKTWWAAHPNLNARIQEYGIWAFELQPDADKEQSADEEIYVGTTPPDGVGWRQDPDTLDTWFSSGLWTFSTLGWPEATKDLKIFHPTSLMETGYDILFFWVARMIIMSNYLMGEIPFETVYLHGLIRDVNGEKMSKSKPQTCIDPLAMIDRYGADAIRLSLVIGNTPGNDSRLSEDKIASYRNFTNKIWNISRYILLTVEDHKLIAKRPPPSTMADRWILAELNNLISFTKKALDEYQYSIAGEKIYEFTWSKLADWYLEIAKIEKSKTTDGILLFVLQNLLKLWHPFMPFATEEIWKNFSRELLMIQDFPKATRPADAKIIKNFELIREIVVAIRNLRAQNKIEPAKKIKAIIAAGPNVILIKKQAAVIKSLARLDELSVEVKAEKPTQAASAVAAGVTIYVPLAGLLDLGKEKSRIENEMAEIEKYLIGLNKKLADSEFIQKAPAPVIASAKEKLRLQQEKLKKLDELLKSLG